MSAKADFTAVMKILAKGSFPFAVYRLPGEDTVKVLIDRSEDLHVVENANADRGFVFAPFASESVPSVLLRPGAVTEFPMSSLPPAENMPRQTEGVYRWGEEDREHYVELVGRAKDALQQGTLEKVVVSRRVALPCSRVDAAGRAVSRGVRVLFFAPSDRPLVRRIARVATAAARKTVAQHGSGWNLALSGRPDVPMGSDKRGGTGHRQRIYQGCVGAQRCSYGECLHPGQPVGRAGGASV